MVFGEDKIVFEYGAEASTPLTQVFPDTYQLDTRINEGRIAKVSSPKISGNYVIQSYHPPPPKDYDHKYSTWGIRGKDLLILEGYSSVKIKFSALSLEPNPDWGPNLCDWQIRWGPATGDKLYRWLIGSRFTVHPTTKRISATLDAGRLPDGIWFNEAHSNAFSTGNYQSWNSPFTVFDLGGDTIRLMSYWKFDGVNSKLKAWANDQLIMDITSNLDPRSYPEWNNNPVTGGACAFWNGGPYPNVSWGLYQGELSFENLAWYDDLVIATEYIPSSYEVTG